jgi:hypothetical protein
MIQNGFRLFTDDEGDLRLAQIVDWSVNELVPSAMDRGRALGYYDESMNFLEQEIIRRKSDFKTGKERASFIDSNGLGAYKDLPP